jgi:50S ribosomal protein L16 3-hydroxylase
MIENLISRLIRLNALIQPLSEREFLKRYWPNSPYWTHHGSDFLDPSWATQASGILDELLGMWKNRVRIHERHTSGKYNNRIAQSEDARLSYGLGATLSFDRLEKFSQPVRSALAEMSVALNVPSSAFNCAIFVSPQNEGVPTHFDGKENFIVQLCGKKRWFISANHVISYPIHDYLPDAPRQPELQLYASLPLENYPPPPETTIDLEPGSVLFLPRGFWHQTAATTDSVSLSIAIATPTRLEVLLGDLRAKLVRNPIWRSPVIARRATENWRRSAGDELKKITEGSLRTISRS